MGTFNNLLNTQHFAFLYNFDGRFSLFQLQFFFDRKTTIQINFSPYYFLFSELPAKSRNLSDPPETGILQKIFWQAENQLRRCIQNAPFGLDLTIHGKVSPIHLMRQSLLEINCGNVYLPSLIVKNIFNSLIFSQNLT